MGHSDTAMTVRNGGRWIPEAGPDAGNKAVELFAGKCCDKAAIAGDLQR